MGKTILLVCTGNTCRSVMAQGILQELLREMAEDEPLHVLSAGVAASLGAEASEEAMLILEERGIDIGRHRSRPVSESLLAGADLVLAMTRSQSQMMKRIFPGHAEKIYSLKEYVGEEGDIEDPIGMPVAVYRKTSKKMERLLLKAAKKFLQELES
jgi:protein-tyrosine-phosphatase